ncbi:MAG: efflux RND transporter periplasmic adaptor subunit [Gammaproteobacteria bacterium]
MRMATSLLICVSLYICTLPFAVMLPVQAAEADSQPSVLVQTAVIAERTVAMTVQSFGTIEPGPRHLKEIVAARASEVELNVLAGAQVKRGDALVTLSATPESAMLYTQAKSQADYARSSLERTRSLFKEKLATRDQLAAAEKTLSDAEANLTAQQQMGGGHAVVVRAPMSGVVTAVNVASGARVVANTSVLTLVEQGGLFARLGVTPGQASAIQIGMPVILDSAFNSKSSLQSKVSQVSGQVDPASGLVDVLVPVTGKSAEAFLPGTQLTAEITTMRVHSLAVPRSAVLRDAQGAYVFIVGHNVAHRVNVKTGNDDGTWIAVRGPLQAGDRVVTLGNYELTDGMTVREPAL